MLDKIASRCSDLSLLFSSILTIIMATTKMFRRCLSTSRVIYQQSSTPTVAQNNQSESTSQQSPSSPDISERYAPREKKLPSIFNNKVPAEKRVPVNPNHGLYAFFERRQVDNTKGEQPDGTGNGNQISSTLPTWTESQSLSSRSWRASELRLKSFEDLHTLWFILLRERNLLSTQLEESRRLGVDIQQSTRVNERRYRVRKSMSRIKFVLSERHHSIRENVSENIQ